MTEKGTQQEISKTDRSWIHTRGAPLETIPQNWDLTMAASHQIPWSLLHRPVVPQGRATGTLKEMQPLGIDCELNRVPGSRMLLPGYICDDVAGFGTDMQFHIGSGLLRQGHFPDSWSAILKHEIGGSNACANRRFASMLTAIGIRRPGAAKLAMSPPVSIGPSRKFIDGVPMKSATKRVAGESNGSSGVPTCSILPPFIRKILPAMVMASIWSRVT